MPKKFATDVFKTASKRAIKKTTETTGGLIDDDIADKITKDSKTLPQKSPETVINEAENMRLGREIPKERYISSEKEQKVIDDQRLK